MSAAEYLAEVKRVAEAWPSEEPPYMLYASTELILSGNYDDAVREGFDAGVEWAEHANRDRTLRLVAALEAVLGLAEAAARVQQVPLVPRVFSGDPFPAVVGAGDVIRAIEAALAEGEDGSGR